MWSRGLSLARKSALAVASALERMGATTDGEGARGVEDLERVVDARMAELRAVNTELAGARQPR